MSIIDELAAFLLDNDEVSNRLEKFVIDNCADFVLADQDANPDSLMDQKVEWSALHQKFNLLLEGELEGFLTSKGVSQEAFAEASRAEIAKGQESQNIILEWILCLSDYKMFVLMMADRRRMLSAQQK